MLLACLAPSILAHAPRFDGIFVAPNPSTSIWTEASWRSDFEAMAAVGMSFLVLPHTARQIGPPSALCAGGMFEVFFDARGLPGACYKQVGLSSSAQAGGTVGAVLAAANATRMSVHLGLAFESNQDDPLRNASTVKHFASVQWELAQHLYRLASSIGLSSTLAGFYTETEESNSDAWLRGMELFTAHYLQPLARDIHAQLHPDLVVFASPYAVANRTRYGTHEWIVPSLYAGLWEQTLTAWAPDLDTVALQDSTGALGNSFADVRALLGNLSAAVARTNRSAWTNVELFEVWPRSCEWPDVCHGRHPAPFERIRQQLENEAPLLVGPDAKIIAWEWSSCLSPTAGNGAAFPEANRANYAAYKAYYSAGLVS